jgi:hypothetical protein
MRADALSARVLTPDGGAVLRADPPAQPFPDVAASGGTGDHALERSRGKILSRILRREARIIRLRLFGSARRRVRSVHRLPAPGPSTGIAPQRLRDLGLGGALVVMSSDQGVTDAERAVADAGVRPTGRRVIRAAGSVLQPGLHVATAMPVMLRVGATATSGDPSRSAAGLTQARASGLALAPALIDQGRSGSASWSVETRLPGRPVRRLVPTTFSALVTVWAALPSTDGHPPDRVQRDLRSIITALPELGPSLEEVGDAIAPTLRELRPVFGHGDLWAGNLLFDRGRLTGVVDWDAWSDRELPGVDLLQLYATSWRFRVGRPLGAAWLEQPWNHPAFTHRMRPYWRAVGIEPNADYLAMVGLSWWAREIAGTLERYPQRRRDTTWRRANVEPVLACGPADLIRRAAGRTATRIDRS